MSRANNFTPKDFSPIYKWPAVPDRKGWYVSAWGKNLVDLRHGRTSPDTFQDWWYWDGRQWRTAVRGRPAFCQEREWFGLREEYKP